MCVTARRKLLHLLPNLTECASCHWLGHAGSKSAATKTSSSYLGCRLMAVKWLLQLYIRFWYSTKEIVLAQW